MDPQLLTLLVAIAAGLIALVILRFVARIAHLGCNLIVLAAVAVIAYLLLSGR